MTKVEAEIIGKRTSLENFLQLQELFLDHHGDYQPRSIQYLIRGGISHEIEIDKLLET
jgi:hypothetical protein